MDPIDEASELPSQQPAEDTCTLRSHRIREHTLLAYTAPLQGLHCAICCWKWFLCYTSKGFHWAAGTFVPHPGVVSNSTTTWGVTTSYYHPRPGRWACPAQRLVSPALLHLPPQPGFTLPKGTQSSISDQLLSLNWHFTMFSLSTRHTRKGVKKHSLQFQFLHRATNTFKHFP